MDDIVVQIGESQEQTYCSCSIGQRRHVAQPRQSNDALMRSGAEYDQSVLHTLHQNTSAIGNELGLLHRVHLTCRTPVRIRTTINTHTIIKKNDEINVERLIRLFGQTMKQR